MISFENLFRAWKDAAKRKRRKERVCDFEFNLTDNLWQLSQALRDGTWMPGRYTSFIVHENGVRRLISAAPFPDRVVHHALINVLEPIWERRFLGFSYANRKGKGTHAAMFRALQGVRQYRYCLKCDIQRYFPSIDHQILMEAIRRHVRDKRVLEITQKIIDSGRGLLTSEYKPVLFPGDDLTALMRPKGLPIGNQTSQFFANVMLHPLDIFIAQEIRPAVVARYVDDFLLFHDDRDFLLRARERIEEKLALLRLALHPNKSRVLPCADGVRFVGYRLTPQQIRLPRGTVSRMRRRLKRLKRSYERGTISRQTVMQSVSGMEGHVKFSQGQRIFAILKDAVPLCFFARSATL